MRRNKNVIPQQDSGVFNLSISDLMAGLLSVFILALCIFILSFTQKTAVLTETNIKREKLVKHLEKVLVDRGIKVTVDEKRGILRIPEDSLSFRVGSADVPNVDTVVKIGTVLL